MAETLSTMLDLGTIAPDFRLRDAVTGREVSLGNFDGTAGLLVMFICNHCPYVIHVRDQLGFLARDYEGRIAIVAINANSLETHPHDGPENMRKLALDEGWNFPFLFDSTQQVAKAYRAACTPDFFLFDRDRRLAYRGRLDGSRPGSRLPVTGRELRAAIDATLAGTDPSPDQNPSIGCSIKWKPGGEPDYLASA
ncbi:MAG: thioredoxin family protein [Deltaproteobacteria bacterium]|nr:thioredoxin family protein [Deltaproteobacteria bacterium]